MSRMLCVLALAAAFATAAEAKVVGQTVEYAHGDAVLEGYLAYDDEKAGPRPGILVVHEWNGLGSYVKKRVEQLAGLGYVAMAADIYGKGVRPVKPQDCAKEMGRYKNDRALLRARAQVALDRLMANERVDKTKLAVMGYCFGGLTALEVARSGADIRAAVSFHGALDAPTRDEGKKIKAKVLVCHGADDKFIPEKDIAAFQQEMRDGGVDWQMIYYGGAVHSFTNPDADAIGMKGLGYHADADRRSWAAMLALFDEAFGAAK